MQHYVNTELRYHAIAGPFCNNPFPPPLICSPLQTVPKHGSSKRRVVMDLSFPPHASVNIGILDSSYLNKQRLHTQLLNKPYKLRLPGIDWLCEFILQLGQGCFLYKLDLQHAYRQIPIDPKDYHLLGFRFNNLLYFDTPRPFGLKTCYDLSAWSPESCSSFLLIWANLRHFIACSFHELLGPYLGITFNSPSLYLITSTSEL